VDSPKQATKPTREGGRRKGARRGHGALTILLLIVLFAGGLLHWMLFFHYGDISFKSYDWQKEYTYYSILREAVSSGAVPHHVAKNFHGTNRFLALPETNLSPQVLLLPLMSVGRFILVNTLILYSVGFLGCLLIMRRFALSVLPFTVLFLIFNLNGHITSQIGVGHSMWGAYFLLPLFFLATMDLVEMRSKRTTPIKLAFILFFMVLQGGLHIYVWALTFLVLFLIFNLRYLKPIALTVAFSVLLSAFRLLPAAFALAGRKERFIWSYPTLRDLVDSLITIRQQTPERLLPWGTVGWWEYDVYVGIIGLIFILWFGVFSRLGTTSTSDQTNYKRFDLPLLVMGALSLSYIHAFITRIPFPLLRSERVATRFIVLPLLLVTLLATIRFNDYLKRTGLTIKTKIAAIVGVALMILGFVDHSYLWSVVRLDRIFRDKAVDLSVPDIITIQDTGYKSLILFSAILSAAGVGLLVYLLLRYGTRREHTSPK
jgi:hypothetical protein